MDNTQMIDRALYKQLKSMNREEMNRFVRQVYEDAVQSAEAHYIVYNKLREDISKVKGIGENRLNEIMAIIDKHIDLSANAEQE